MREGQDLIQSFLAYCEKEAPKVGKAWAKRDVDTDAGLVAILSRFDCKKRGRLDAEESALACRILERLHRPSAKGLTSLLQVLTYLDLNENQVVDFAELNATVEILDLFCKADSVNDTLSLKELEMLEAVLQYLDRDQRGVLDNQARAQLRENMWDPDAFLAEQKKSNPLLKKVLGGRD